ncbi:MAG: ABC transporter ATP-binding protein [Bacteroidales bacterium]|nr:ABC transporter ATP-binding protein [Bacteroidales bacterium]
MDKEDNILEVKNLSVSFDGRTVVDNVSYALRRGRTLGIVGESGSGKSVSSLAIMGLLPKNATVSGRIELRTENGELRTENGEQETESVDLLSLDERQMQGVRGRRVAMIFQEPMTSLNPVQKCAVQVVEMLRLHEDVSYDEARRRTIELFKEVLLPRPEKIFDSYPFEISGGQKQRVMIAMALICKPDVIIADEPTTALDVTVQKTILELLRDLQRSRNIAVIFITHDLGVIAQIADDIAVMYHGQIVEHGDANDILHHPQHPYTQGLLACRPPMDSRPRHLPTVEEFMRAESGKRKAESEERKTESGKRETESGETLLSVRNLDVTYTLEKNIFGKPLKKLKAVDGISFDVYRGETLGLVGESGCGKTTLGRAIMRLVDSSSGSITFDGRRLDTLSQREMRSLRPRIQIIFQDPYSSLNPRMTVGQTIAEPLRVHQRDGRLSQSEIREKVIDLMGRVGLDADWFDRYPHEFSGGQRQRICIARALILNPDLVICDESVSALDVSVQAQVLNLLNELKEQFGYTYIFISHDLSVVHFISDRIMVMQSGRMVELGDADALFSHPAEAYTQTLIDAIPRIE